MADRMTPIEYLTLLILFLTLTLVFYGAYPMWKDNNMWWAYESLGAAIAITIIAAICIKKMRREQKELKNDIKSIKQALDIEKPNPVPKINGSESSPDEISLLINIRDLIQESNEYSKGRQEKIIYLTVVATIIAVGALGIGTYAVNKEFYPYAMSIFIFIGASIIVFGYLFKNKKNR